MRLTAQELEEMRSVDIGAVEADKLADVSGMAFDSRLSLEDRAAHFLSRAVNPYCFCVGSVGGQDRVCRGRPLAPGQAGRPDGAAEERALKPLRRSLFRL